MKKIALSALFTFLILACPAFGQSVKLPESVKVAPGRLAAVLVEYEGDDFRYRASPDLDVFREYDPDPKKIRLRLIGYVAGKYELSAIACKGGKLSEFAACVVTIEGAVPTPPKPDPLPPVGKVAWVVVLEETSQRTPETARVLADLAGWNALGVAWRHYDKDAAEAKQKKYGIVASQAGVTLPAVILLGAGGEVLRVAALPASVAEVKGMVK